MWLPTRVLLRPLRPLEQGMETAEGCFSLEGCSSGPSGRSGSSGLLEKITLTTDETALLRQIGQQTKGPRHTTTLSADPRTIGTVNGLAEKGLAACTGFVPRVGGDELLRVCLTGKGWVKFRGLRSEHTERGDATND